MENSLPFIGVIVLVALAFDFINGFHDAANSIATVVSTRVLPPLWAVVWAAFFNFSAAFLFGTAVANTVGAGMVGAARESVNKQLRTWREANVVDLEGGFIVLRRPAELHRLTDVR